MKENKTRLDILLLYKGLAESREKAKALVMSGIVYVDNILIDKPGTMISNSSNIIIKGNKSQYVSRGGLKLSKALEYFNIDVNGKIVADIGASTGGFTDCLLQNGALKVYAIDVGYGQLAWKLRKDNKVIVMERTNIRYVTPEMIQEKIDFATIDVSFISLTKVLPAVKGLLDYNGEIVCLIKPQFEAGREKVGKKGVVKDSKVHEEVIVHICRFIENDLNMSINGLTFSPIKGPKGNIEYLIYIHNEDCKNKAIFGENIIKRIVKESHFYSF